MLEERKKIMEAALDDFSEVGLSNSSFESIAGRAGLEPAVLRALFVDKETLLRELFQEKTEPMVSAISLAVEEIHDPKALIRKSMEHLDRWLLMNPKVVKLYMQSSLEESEVQQTTFQKYMLPSEYFDRLNQFIEEGKFRCSNILILTTLLDSLIVFLHMIRSGMMMISPDLSFEQIAQQRFDAVMDLLEKGLYTY
ncbi:MAG: TetR/AcrR family transcriptional regulator [Candidatus Aminicenantaceae bacterium]